MLVMNASGAAWRLYFLKMRAGEGIRRNGDGMDIAKACLGGFLTLKKRAMHTAVLAPIIFTMPVPPAAVCLASLIKHTGTHLSYVVTLLYGIADDFQKSVHED